VSSHQKRYKNRTSPAQYHGFSSNQHIEPQQHLETFPNKLLLLIFNLEILFFNPKMKFTFATILSLLAATISAAPLEVRQSSTVTVALSNDQTGAYSSATFQADNTDKSIASLYGSTSVGNGGTVKATAAQLTSFAQSINCIINNNGATIGTLTAQHTYVDLDGNPNTAIPINLNNAVIRCHV
jgi:hypothetical protein